MSPRPKVERDAELTARTLSDFESTLTWAIVVLVDGKSETNGTIDLRRIRNYFRARRREVTAARKTDIAARRHDTAVGQ